MAGKLFGKKIQKKEVFYGSFAIGVSDKKDAFVAQSARNCDCGDGTLARNFGMYPYTLNNINYKVSAGLVGNIFVTWDSDSAGNKRERIGYVTYQNAAFIFSQETATFSNIGVLAGGGSLTSAIDKDGKYQTIFVSSTGVYRLDERRLIQCAPTVCNSVACFCNGRVFTADDCRLVYSAPFAPTDYTENVDDSGAIFMRHDCGKIVGLATLKNRLCILYEYGVSMMEIGGSARSFVRKDVAYNGAKIFGETLCVANVGGEKAYFLAEDGIYRFDGANVEKVCKNIPIRAETKYPFGRAVVENKYLVTFMANTKTWRTICVDLESGLGSETFLMSCLPAYGEKAVFRNGSGLFVPVKNGALPTGEKASFFVPKTDFSMPCSKTLTGLRFTGEGNFEITVSNGEISHTQNCYFEGGVAKITLALRSKEFSVTIRPAAATVIRTMTAELQTLA